MSKDARSLNTRTRRVIGLACIALGCLPIAAGLGILPGDSPEPLAPAWVVVLAGCVFMIAGLMVLFAHYPRANDALAGILLAMFGAVGAWVAIGSSGQGMSGGVPFLPRDINVMFGRWVFGFGALVSVALSVYAFRRSAGKMRRKRR